MTKKTKALVYQFLCFAVFFIALRFIIEAYSNLTGFWIPVTAAVVATILSPQFQVVKSNEGEKLFMKWIFLKGVKELK
jgi:hypothetical protein